MILDSGICSIFRENDRAIPGSMPDIRRELLCKSWYGELSFETAPVFPTGRREDARTDARIRVHQDRRINNHDVVVLADVETVPDEGMAYDVVRAFHGADEDTGQPITDITLQEVER